MHDDDLSVPDTKANILELDHKLKGLKNEIETKINDFSLNQDVNSKEIMSKLHDILDEIDKAIDGVKSVVKLVNDE